MEEREAVVDFIHSVSKDLKMRPISIFGINMVLGVPKTEIRSFLDHPQGINQDDVIKAARVACAVAGFLSKNVCPLIGE